MIEAIGDLWKDRLLASAICITTNGDVNREGRAVMGRGVAKQAAERFPQLPRLVACSIWAIGNHVAPILENLVTFPVKHHWDEKADFHLIERSARELVQLANDVRWTDIRLPRPGCGNGGLRWQDVRPLLEPILDDRFLVYGTPLDAARDQMGV